MGKEKAAQEAIRAMSTLLGWDVKYEVFDDQITINLGDLTELINRYTEDQKAMGQAGLFHLG